VDVRAIFERFYHLLAVPDRNPQKCDFIVVLSYAVSSKTTLTPMTEACCKTAYKLWRKFPEAKIIMSTGDNQDLGVPNSRVMVSHALKMGIPKRALIEEGNSWNTYENLVYSWEIIKKFSIKYPKVVIIAYDLHMRRSLLTAAKVHLPLSGWISAHSKAGKAYGFKGLFQTRSRGSMFLYDILAIIFSKMRGWI
jgi:uncharacterized SAM-binding protein YcdF (DUF218 family)